MDTIVLPTEKRADVAKDVVHNFHREFVDEVRAVVEREPWVVVGMAQNPVVGKARKFLDSENIPYKYLGYGSYMSMWKPRLALKLWAGFPTFPMIFRNGVLLGGLSELKKLKSEGKLLG